jgi:hypothetical protein
MYERLHIAALFIDGAKQRSSRNLKITASRFHYPRSARLSRAMHVPEALHETMLTAETGRLRSGLSDAPAAAAAIGRRQSSPCSSLLHSLA